MNCFTKKQIQECVHGKVSEGYEAHLAECATCRTELLKTMAEENRDCDVSPELAQKTIDKIVSFVRQRKEKGIVAKRFDFSLYTSPFVKIALAAGVAAVFIGGYFLIKGPFHDAVAIKQKAISPSLQTENVVSKNEGNQKKNTVFVFDSVTVRVGKIPVRKDKESLIRFGGKTGIAAGPGTMLDVKSRSDTTALVVLTKGNALFSIEKNKFKEFVVQTPTLNIVVTGTVFSVIADSGYTMVNVIEGTVSVRHLFKSQMTESLEEGNGAFANRDSIIDVMIENSQILKVREKLLRDYIEGTMFQGLEDH
jgi:hypothetical protein